MGEGIERQRETLTPGGRCGANASLRWGEIRHALAAKVDAAPPQQHPWFSAELARLVFGGPPERGDVGLRVTEGTAGADAFGAGTLADVSKGAVVAVYPPMPPPPASPSFKPLGSLEDFAERLGAFPVTTATRSSATAVADPSKPLPAGARGRLMKPGRGATVRLAVEGDGPALAARVRASHFVEEVPAGAPCDAMLVRYAPEPGAWEISDELYGPGEGVVQSLPRLPALVLARPAPAVADLDPVVAYVDHYHRFTAPVRLARRCGDLPGALRLTLLDASGLTAPADMYCVRADNASSALLYLWLFLCEDSGAVKLYNRKEEVQPGSHKLLYPAEFGMGTPIAAVLPAGRARGADRLVLLGTTDPDAAFDALAVAEGFEDVLRGASRGGASPFAKAFLWTSAIAVLRLSV